MALGPAYQFPRGTRSALEALAAGGGLLDGQGYVLTDTSQLAIAMSTRSFAVSALAELWSAPVTPPKVVAEGDSITFNSASYANSWAATNSTVPYYSPAQGGAGIGDSTDAPGANTLWGRIDDVVAAAPRILTILIGANDLITASSTSDWLARLFAYIAEVRRRVPGVRVLLSTVLPVDEVRQPGRAGHNARRATVNPLIRAAVGNEIDAVIPMGDDPVVMTDTAAADPDLFADGLHPSGAIGAMAAIYAAVLDPMIAGATGNTPAAFTLTDRNNLDPSTEYTSDPFYVTGMGVGQSVTATVAGGTSQLRQGAFDAVAKAPVFNGDPIRVRATTAAAEATGTDVVVSVGTVSDTLTLTTSAPPASDVTLAAAAAQYADNFGYFANSYTASVPLLAGRPLLKINPQGGTAPYTVKINGVTAQALSGDGLVVVGAAELAAGNYPVEVSTASGGQAYRNVTFTVTALTNAGATTETSTLTYAYRADSSHSGDASITVPTSGIEVIFYYNEVGSFDVPSDATIVRDFGTGDYILTTTASGVPAIKSNAFTNTYFFAVGFAPA